MPRGGGGGCRGGGGGYRSGGAYCGGSSTSTSSGMKTSSGKEGSSSNKQTSTDEKFTTGGSRGTPGQGSSYSSTTTRSSEAIHTLGPSSKACKNAHQELRTCLEANGDRMSSCHWYLTQWKTCQQQSLCKSK